jgi:hypothetical protein
VGFVTFWGILCVCYAKECEVKGSNARQNGIFCEKMWHFINSICDGHRKTRNNAPFTILSFLAWDDHLRHSVGLHHLRGHP